MEKVRPLKKDYFSLNETRLKDIFQFAKPMGHHENPDHLNLGFGFLYYGIANPSPAHCPKEPKRIDFCPR